MLRITDHIKIKLWQIAVGLKIMQICLCAWPTQCPCEALAPQDLMLLARTTNPMYVAQLALSSVCLLPYPGQGWLPHSLWRNYQFVNCPSITRSTSTLFCFGYGSSQRAVMSCSRDVLTRVSLDQRTMTPRFWPGLGLGQHSVRLPW